MKKILAFAMVLMMVLSLAACGGKDEPAPTNNDTPAGPQQTQNEAPPTESHSVSNEASAQAQPVGDLADMIPKPEDGEIVHEEDGHNSHTITINWTDEEAKSYAEAAQGTGFDQNADVTDVPGAMYSFKADNANGYSLEVTCNFGSGIIRIASGADSPGTSQQEQTSTPASKEPGETADTDTVAGFLALYGWAEDDLKPEHFIAFGELEMDGSKKAGEVGSTGFITISADKAATTPEDVNAWFETVYAKMQQLSSDGKLYKNFQMNAEATPIETLMEGPLWADMPGGSCAYSCKLASGDADLQVSTRYDYETGVYKLSIAVLG